LSRVFFEKKVFQRIFICCQILSLAMGVGQCERWKSFAISDKLLGVTIAKKAAAPTLRKIKFYFLEILRAGQ